MFRKEIKYTFTVLDQDSASSLYVNPKPGLTHSSEGIKIKPNQPYGFPYLWTDDITECIPVGLWSVNQAENSRIELYHSVGEHREQDLAQIFKNTPNVNDFPATARFIKRIYQYLDGLDSDQLKIIIAHNIYVHKNIDSDVDKIRTIVNDCIAHINATNKPTKPITPFTEDDSRLTIVPIDAGSFYLTANNQYGIIEEALQNTLTQMKEYLNKDKHHSAKTVQLYLRELEQIEKAEGSYHGLADRKRFIAGLENIKKMAHKKLIDVSSPAPIPDTIIALNLIAFDPISSQPSLLLLKDWWQSVQNNIQKIKIKNSIEEAVERVGQDIFARTQVPSYKPR